jgi:hypothetical protein
MHRLLTACEIDDAQSGMSQADMFVCVRAEGIRSPMLEHIEHVAKKALVNRASIQVHNACDSAHFLKFLYP